MAVKKMTRLSMLLALSIVLGIMESTIPFLNGMIPGIKLGLANIIVLVVLFKYGSKEAILLSLLRVFIIGLLRTGIFHPTFFFSLSGAFFSCIAMTIAHRLTTLSCYGISVVGALFHSLGQLLIATIFLHMAMWNYIPFFLLFSIPTGLIIGYFGTQLIQMFPNEESA